MRQSIAIAAIVALSAIAADASAQSRYGPRPSPAPGEVEPLNPPPGAMLAWKGKTARDEQAVSEAPVPRRPEPVAPWSQRLASITPAAPRALPEPASGPVNPPAPPPQVQPQAPAPLPTSLYDAPAPRPAPPPAPVQRPPAAPVATRPTAPQQPQTALLGEPRITQPHQPGIPDPATLPPPNRGPRFYSVYREYGVVPDSIPVAPNVGRADEVQLKDVPSTPTLASPDDTQYVPPRTNQSEAAANRTH